MFSFISFRTIKVFLFAVFVTASFVTPLLVPIQADAAGLVPCGTGNNPPCTLCHLVVGVKGVIDWGMSVMTFFAIAIIVAMAIVYIVSAGDSGMMSTAKNGIKSTMIGFAVMLGGWVIVNTFMTVLANNTNAVGHADNWYTFTCDQSSKTQQINQNAPTPTSTTPGALSCSTGKCATNQQISQAVKSNKSGVDPNILMAIIDGGEGCNKSKSPAGACGYAQVIDGPKYYLRSKVCGIPGSPTRTCEAVQSDLQLDINCGAKMIKEDFMKRCGSDIKSISSCYNTGNKNKCGEGSPPYCQRVTSYYNSCVK